MNQEDMNEPQGGVDISALMEKYSQMPEGSDPEADLSAAGDAPGDDSQESAAGADAAAPPEAEGSTSPPETPKDSLSDTIARAKAVIEQKEAAEQARREADARHAQVQSTQKQLDELRALAESDPFEFLERTGLSAEEFVARAIAKSEGKPFKPSAAPNTEEAATKLLQQRIDQLERQLQNDRDAAFDVQMRGFVAENAEAFPLLSSEPDAVTRIQQRWADVLHTTGKSLSLDEAAASVESDLESDYEQKAARIAAKKERRSAQSSSEPTKPSRPGAAAKPTLSNKLTSSAPVSADALPSDPDARFKALMRRLG